MSFYENFYKVKMLVHFPAILSGNDLGLENSYKKKREGELPIYGMIKIIKDQSALKDIFPQFFVISTKFRKYRIWSFVISLVGTQKVQICCEKRIDFSKLHVLVHIPDGSGWGNLSLKALPENMNYEVIHAFTIHLLSAFIGEVERC